MMFDTIFKAARIVDGTGAPWYRGDVGVVEGTIAAVGDLSKDGARHVVEVNDRILCPGFIDVHTHSDFVIFRDPVMLSKLSQGVTTQLTGQCGQSAAPVSEKYQDLLESYLGFIMAGTKTAWNWRTFDEWLKEAEKLPLATNVATCLGHGTLRVAVMGFENRTATAQEIEQMKSLAREALSAGAFGITSGLIYPPGVFATQEELWELAALLSEYNGLYLTHMRGESQGLVDSVEETIELGRRSRIPVQISHHKALGKDNWGSVKESLKRIDQARNEGIDITLDQYPYNHCSTSVRACLPPWAQADGVDGICERLGNIDMRRKIADEIRDTLDMSRPCKWESMLRHCGGASGALIVYCPATPQWEGKNLLEIAHAMNIDPVEAAFEIIIANKGSDLACYAAISEDDIETVLVHPATMIGADSIPAAEGAKTHPRSFGTHPRVLALYVREKKILSLENAVHKMTGMPSARLGLQKKGIVRVGMDADILVFDPDAVRDNATYENPVRFATGMDYVYIGGHRTIENGVYTGDLGGGIIRKSR